MNALTNAFHATLTEEFARVARVARVRHVSALFESPFLFVDGGRLPNGASVGTLERRVGYGGRKGRVARRRLLAAVVPSWR